MVAAANLPRLDWRTHRLYRAEGQEPQHRYAYPNLRSYLDVPRRNCLGRNSRTHLRTFRCVHHGQHGHIHASVVGGAIYSSSLRGISRDGHAFALPDQNVSSLVIWRLHLEYLKGELRAGTNDSASREETFRCGGVNQPNRRRGSLIRTGDLSRPR